MHGSIPGPGPGPGPCPGPGAGAGPRGSRRPGRSARRGAWPHCTADHRTGDHRTRRLRRALLGLAADVLSGPGGLAAHLRCQLAGLGTLSQPPDIGAAAEIIPAHLRRAVTARHRHCAFPGCDQPASACQIHHLIARARGGPTALRNLVPLCSFHHLVAIHRWGWTLTLNPDATTTATSPDGSRTLHSHSPPARAA